MPGTDTDTPYETPGTDIGADTNSLRNVRFSRGFCGLSGTDVGCAGLRFDVFDADGNTVVTEADMADLLRRIRADADSYPPEAVRSEVEDQDDDVVVDNDAGAGAGAAGAAAAAAEADERRKEGWELAVQCENEETLLRKCNAGVGPRGISRADAMQCWGLQCINQAIGVLTAERRDTWALLRMRPPLIVLRFSYETSGTGVGYLLWDGRC
eukprot:3574820-Rhodomonas_salina.1